MSVDGHSHGLPEGVAEDNVGGLPPHAREADQLLHRRRHRPPVVGDQGSPEVLERLRLVAVEAGLLDQLLELRQARLGEGAGGGQAAEELGGHLVHLLVRALRGEDGGDQKLQRRPEVEGEAGRRVGLLEDAEDLHDPGLLRPLRLPARLPGGDSRLPRPSRARR